MLGIIFEILSGAVFPDYHMNLDRVRDVFYLVMGDTIGNNCRFVVFLKQKLVIITKCPVSMYCILLTCAFFVDCHVLTSVECEQAPAEVPVCLCV